MASTLVANQLINARHRFVSAVNHECETAVVRSQEDILSNCSILFINGYRLVPGNITYPEYKLGLTVFHSEHEVVKHTHLPIRVVIPEYAPGFRIYLHKTKTWWSNQLIQLPEEVTPLAYKTINLLLT